MVQTIPLFGPVPGGMEMMVILLIAVLLFGANKIPKLARSTGEAMGEFKKGRQEVEDELQEMQSGGSSSTDLNDDDDYGTETQTETETSTSSSSGDASSE
ncbi:Sec-independent protein translocase subunit TatA/TatB [Halorussus halophilus]|uniref:Sec-independent protein translocase subunit TatA/TatB n=1 Tax=Halorussus halophilus TaxID=2650975 RepID=UPI001301329C|nr:twin-arginine translocase TatA/TatE family subunit [Halorussus halophilus]